MAISVSDEFKSLWRKKSGRFERQRIGYKRRYWNGSAFVNESSFTFLTEDDVVKFGKTPMSLDQPNRNVFKTGQVSFVFHNRFNEWLQTTVPPSIFAADAVSPTLGYTIYRTIFQLQRGYKLSAGTIEWVAVFTGLGLKSRITGKGATATVLVADFSHKLVNADAEEVADTFTLEDCVPATGDGSRTDFESTSIGVDHLTDLQEDAVSETEGSDFRVSNANEVAGGGNTGRLGITEDAAPANGDTMKCSGKKWKQDNKIETLLGLLYDEAGIESADRTIDPVLFPGGLSGSKTVDSQAEWEAGTFVNIDSKSVPGSIRRRWHLIDNWTDGDFSNPTWTNSGATISAGELVGTSGDLVNLDATLLNALTQGTYVFEDIDVSSGDVEILIARNEGSGPGGPAGTRLLIRYDGSTLKLFKFDVSTSVYTQVGSTITVSGTITVKAHYTKSTGAVELGVSGGSPGLMTATTSVNLKPEIFFDFSGNVTVGDIYFSNEIINDMTVSAIGDLPDGSTPVYESEEFDLLAAPTGWGKLDAVETLNGFSVTYATKVASVSGGPFDAYVDIAGDGTIQSSLKRFLKVRATITAGGVGIITTPEIAKYVANFETTLVFVSLANHRGETCFQASTRYVGLADYELRFGGDGHAYVSSKVASASPTVELTQENGIIDILDYDTGIPDRVRNVGRVRHGGAVAIYDGTSASEASPTSEEEYGRKVKDESIETLVANDVNIAAGRAQAIFENSRRSATDARPPVRIRAKISVVPWAELSDVMRLFYFDHPIMRRIQANDPLIKPGPYSTFGDPANILSNSKDWKVLSYNPDYDAKDDSAEVLLEEVL